MNNHEIQLFAGLGMSTHQARRTILAYSGAKVISEWSSTQLAEFASCFHQLYYASIRTQPAKDSTTGAREAGTSMTGTGDSATSAVEDLLWQLVTPHLLEDRLAAGTCPPVGEPATCR